MAIDKNSKAYQNLVKSGYTDEQITQMHSDLSSGQTAKEVVANTQTTPSSTPTAPTTTPTETPTTPTVEDTTVKQEEKVVSTVPEIKQEGALKPLSEEYYQQDTQEAQDKIVANLNNYKQSNPEYFSDYDSFKKNFSYDARSDQQKNTLDQWYKGYTTGLQLSNVPTNDLYTQYKDGQLSNADMESLRIANPTKYTELQNQINKGTIIAAYDDSTAPETMNFQEIAYKMIAESLNRMGSGDYGTSQFFDDYEKKMNSPEMLELSDKTTALQEDITNIQDDIESMRKQVEKEYEGKGASRAKINAIVADRTYDLQLQLRTLNNEYTKYATDYNNRANQYQNEFNLQLQEYQLNMQARNQQMDELGFAMDLMNFETNDQKQEREWNYWVKQQEYQNGNINSSDYQTRYKAALKSVENLLAQYPNIPMQRSAEQMAEDILKGMDANGTTLGDELTKINKQIQGKPEYKYLYNNTYGRPEGITGSYNIGGTEYVIYNGELMTAESFNKAHGGGAKANYTVVSPDKLKVSDGQAGTYGSFFANPKNAAKNYGGQCGKYVNDYLQEIGAGRVFGNEDIKTREGWINSDGAKMGTIAIFDYGKKSSDGINHGHVGIVISNPDKNGNIWIQDSNFGSDGIIQVRQVNINDNSLKGFFDPTLAPNGSSVAIGTNTATLTTNASAGTTTDTTSTLGTTSNVNIDPSKAKYIESEVGLYDAYINNGTTPTDAKLKSLGDGDLNLGWQVWNARVQDYMDKTGAGTLENKKNTEVNKLRTEMHQNQAYSDWNQMQSFFQKIQNSSNNETATAASDVSLLFAYMKMLDPKSIVRESEFATAQNMGSLPTKRQAKLKSAVNGKKLTDAQRTEIYNEAAGLMDGATYLYNNLLDDYASMITLGGDASRLGKKGTYVTDEYISKYGQPTTQTTTTNAFQKWINTATPTTSNNTTKVGKRRPFGGTQTITLSNGDTFNW